jgi:hypothetical protein
LAPTFGQDRISTLQNILERAGAWFLRSGIQEEDGGVARYYRSDLGKNARVSTEITGYAVSALVDFYRRTAKQEYLDAALKAARFLTQSAWNAKLGTFPFEYASNGERPPEFAYFFDSGIIVRGLLRAWRVVRDQELLDAAVNAGRGMLADFEGDGATHPILALPEKRPLPYEAAKWSASPGCYQLKSALAWFELAEETGEQAFQEAYDCAVRRALESEKTFFPGSADRSKIMDRLHAYLYFLEGLLPVARRPECASVYAAGIDRAADYLHDIAPEFARSDVYAQLLRARLFGESAGILSIDATAAANEARETARFQLRSDDARIDGGFCFGSKAGAMLPFVNPVSTAFCVQALALWNDRSANVLQREHASLI